MRLDESGSEDGSAYHMYMYMYRLKSRSKVAPILTTVSINGCDIEMEVDLPAVRQNLRPGEDVVEGQDVLW
jgi:hypothetical protein